MASITERPLFWRHTWLARESCAQNSVGWRHSDGSREPGPLTDALSVFVGGESRLIRGKSLLPTYPPMKSHSPSHREARHGPSTKWGI